MNKIARVGGSRGGGEKNEGEKNGKGKEATNKVAHQVQTKGMHGPLM